jgi:hypothetical protein
MQDLSNIRNRLDQVVNTERNLSIFWNCPSILQIQDNDRLNKREINETDTSELVHIGHPLVPELVLELPPNAYSTDSARNSDKIESTLSKSTVTEYPLVFESAMNRPLRTDSTNSLKETNSQEKGITDLTLKESIFEECPLALGSIADEITAIHPQDFNELKAVKEEQNSPKMEIIFKESPLALESVTNQQKITDSPIFTSDELTNVKREENSQKMEIIFKESPLALESVTNQQKITDSQIFINDELTKAKGVENSPKVKIIFKEHPLVLETVTNQRKITDSRIFTNTERMNEDNEIEEHETKDECHVVHGMGTIQSPVPHLVGSAGNLPTQDASPGSTCLEKDTKVTNQIVYEQVGVCESDEVIHVATRNKRRGNKNRTRAQLHLIEAQPQERYNLRNRNRIKGTIHHDFIAGEGISESGDSDNKWNLKGKVKSKKSGTFTVPTTTRKRLTSKKTKFSSVPTEIQRLSNSKRNVFFDETKTQYIYAEELANPRLQIYTEPTAIRETTPTHIFQKIKGQNNSAEELANLRTQNYLGNHKTTSKSISARNHPILEQQIYTENDLTTKPWNSFGDRINPEQKNPTIQRDERNQSIQVGGLGISFHQHLIDEKCEEPILEGKNSNKRARVDTGRSMKMTVRNNNIPDQRHFLNENRRATQKIFVGGENLKPGQQDPIYEGENRSRKVSVGGDQQYPDKQKSNWIDPTVTIPEHENKNLGTLPREKDLGPDRQKENHEGIHNSEKLRQMIFVGGDQQYSERRYPINEELWILVNEENLSQEIFVGGVPSTSGSQTSLLITVKQPDKEDSYHLAKLRQWLLGWFFEIDTMSRFRNERIGSSIQHLPPYKWKETLIETKCTMIATFLVTACSKHSQLSRLQWLSDRLWGIRNFLHHKTKVECLSQTDILLTNWQRNCASEFLMDLSKRNLVVSVLLLLETTSLRYQGRVRVAGEKTELRTWHERLGGARGNLDELQM